MHIFYGEEEIVGDKAHFDGQRTITITGHPFIINHQRDSVLTADVIVFDTIAETAKLTNGQGESAEGVDRGFVHFQRHRICTPIPTAPRTVSTRTLRPARIRAAAITSPAKAWTSSPATRSSSTKRSSGWERPPSSIFLSSSFRCAPSTISARGRKLFPEVGYDQYEGAWIKMKLPFGKDQYYYGYYIVNYFTKEGLGLGYVGFYASRKGRALGSASTSTSINDTNRRRTNLQRRDPRTGKLLASPARKLPVRLPVELRTADATFRRTNR